MALSELVPAEGSLKGGIKGLLFTKMNVCPECNETYNEDVKVSQVDGTYLIGS